METVLTDEVQVMVETELRKGTSKSRIAHLLSVSYDEAIDVIAEVRDRIRPDLGDEIQFTFRGHPMVGVIEKLLKNSAVVHIYWSLSDKILHDICEEKTIVNFKDILEFVKVRDGKIYPITDFPNEN